MKLTRPAATLNRSARVAEALGFNAHLGDRRPVDVLREGRLSEVIAAIEVLKSGAYA